MSILVGILCYIVIMLKSRGRSPLFLIFVEVFDPALVSLPETNVGNLAALSSDNVRKRIFTISETKFCKIKFWMSFTVVINLDILAVSGQMSSV